VDRIAAESALRVPAAGPAESVEVRVALAGGRTLSGSVPGVVGDVLRAVTYSNVAAKHRLAAWVRLLALTAAHPGRPFTSVVIGRCGKEGVSVATLRRIEPELARERLEDLVALFDEGLRAPLPIYCRTSAAHALGGKPEEEWTSGFSFDKEDREAEHVLVLGEQRPFEAIVFDPDFDAYAHRLWDPLRAYEEVVES
jgi:exodeoxyribonuclease V gamma subunit